MLTSSVLSDIEKRLNTCARVNRLSNELLFRIFAFVAEDYSFRTPMLAEAIAEGSHRAVNAQSLITLTRICRRWRGILLNRPRIWTRVDCDNLARLETFAQRALTLPLSLLFIDKDESSEFGPELDSDFPDDHPNSRMPEIERYADRVTRLDAPSVFTADPTPPRWLFDISLPSLECLNVSFDTNIQDGTEPEEPEECILLGVQTLSLKALAHSWMTPWWYPGNHFPSLTHLCLSYHVGAVLLFMFISILSRCPALEVFHLHNAPPNEAFPDFPPSMEMPVSLPRLRAATLTDWDSGMSLRLLRLFSLPWDRVRIRASDFDLDSAASYISNLPILDHTTTFEVRTTPCGSVHKVHVAIHGASSALWLTGTRRHNELPCYEQYLPAVLPRLSHLTTLSICVPYASPDALARTLASVPLLRTLHLVLPPSTGDPQTALAEFRAFCTLVGQGAPPGPCLPALHELRLCTNTLLPWAAAPSSTQAYADALKDMFAARVRAGLPRLGHLAFMPFACPDRTPQRTEGGNAAPEPGSDSAQEGAVARVREVLVAALAEDVGELEVVDNTSVSSGNMFRGAPLRELWKVEDEEAYWRLPKALQAQDT